MIVQVADDEQATAEPAGTLAGWCAVSGLAWLVVFVGPTDPLVAVPAFLIAVTTVLGLVLRALLAQPEG